MNADIYFVVLAFAGSFYSLYLWISSKKRDYLFLSTSVALLAFWDLYEYFTPSLSTDIATSVSTALVVVILFFGVRLLWKSRS